MHRQCFMKGLQLRCALIYIDGEDTLVLPIFNQAKGALSPELSLPAINARAYNEVQTN